MTLRPGIVASGWLAAESTYEHGQQRKMGRAMLTSLLIHGALLASLLVAVAVAPKEILNSFHPSFDVVYLPATETGPGGGGGGNPNPAPPKRLEVPAHSDPSMVPTAVEKPQEPLPPLLASIQTNTTDLLQASGNSTVSLAAVGGDGLGHGLGPGAGDGVGPGRERGFGDNAYAPGNGVTMPVATFEAKPIFTPEGMRAKIQGDVTLEVVVLADGTVGQVRVVQSLDRASGMDNAAIESARKWRFRPGTKDGKPVATIVRMIVSFRLH
jgi:protein TonB